MSATAGLWDWSLAAYARPGVAEACLALQDGAGQNVPLLLWSAWAAASGRRPDADDIEAACDTARAWTDIAIGPLRDIRRTLKGPIPDLDVAAREAIRDQVKAVELAAERHLLEALESLTPDAAGSPRPVLDGLAQTARVWARVVPRPALTTLAERLSA
ncbi:TIGR02444 family protein [soil metagenome]